MTLPGSVTLTVADATGVLTGFEASPEWRRVGGSTQCGGPHVAEVVVPAP